MTNPYQTTRRRVLATGLAAGALGLTGAAGLDGTAAAQTPCEPNDHRARRQLRGIWIATVVNLNWPSKRGLSVEQQKAELIAMFDHAKAHHYNAIFLQVRSAGQVMFRSDLDPWSAYLTGTQGQDPGYDPLAFAVEQAHARALELHAWLNPYQMVRVNSDHNLAPNHAYVKHPEWAVEYAGTQYFNPGLPEVRRYVEDVIMEAVERYDIDGIHFDDFFYPYPTPGEVFDDSSTYQQYGNGMALADWRRHNVDLLISELRTRIRAAKPWVAWGISPFAVWRNIADDPLGSDTRAGAPTYDTLYADTWKWIREGWIDYIAPQIYWNIGFELADYAVLVPWWSRVVAPHDCHLYIGQAAYRIEAWPDPAEMSNHLAMNAQHDEVDGDIYFSFPYVKADAKGGMSRVHETWYSRPALVPTMPWKGDTSAPKPPKTLSSRRRGGRVEVSVRAGDDSVVRHAIHRLPLTRGRVKADDCRLADAEYLVDVVWAAEGQITWVDPEPADGAVTYVVTSLDRRWNESVPQQTDLR